MTTKSSQIITLSQINSLIDSNIPKKSIIWKEFGNYLDKKVNIITNSKNSSNPFLNNNLIDNSYLSQSIEYKICKSCQRPIGIQSLENHYSKCIEMKQKRQQEIADNQAINNGSNSTTITNNNKKKRKNGALDIDISSSVDSTRNNTPIPNTNIKEIETELTNGNNTNSNNINNNTGKPKKKYKKSQAQKEKEAANAAAAAAAAASTVEKPIKKTKKNSVSQQSSSPTINPAQQKPKTIAKPKGPVDVEKQCGVALPSGGLCARSLTCKTHSMGAKRAVPGRSAPYDVLLQQYQKRNQAKIAQNNALLAQRRENAAFNDDGSDLNFQNSNKILDPDEETHLVLEGLSKNNPIPLERKIMMPVRYRHRFLQAREFYANSLIISAQHSQQQQQQQQQQAQQQQPNGEQQTLANQAISGSIGGLQGRCALINVDAQLNNQQDSQTQSFSAIPGEMYQVRAPSKAILMTAQHNNIQQQAFQQQFLKYQQAQQAQQQQQQQQQMLMRQRQQQQQQQAQNQSNQQQQQPQQKQAQTT
ncbi:hypothetical protein KGF54_000571 [Candida jiufengensis]|uniref:uncharacterized protein n=1 Tax=Candida jiufengensis TaxID=497108 RepID=UPI00222565F9|nr:uncharacterized protein KGF54_000571 [Candida jiufengensis]KAI5956952.1 hypothetical protein KGF54_000571 [Candida jiufengensis]